VDRPTQISAKICGAKLQFIHVMMRAIEIIGWRELARLTMRKANPTPVSNDVRRVVIKKTASIL